MAEGEPTNQDGATPDDNSGSSLAANLRHVWTTVGKWCKDQRKFRARKQPKPRMRNLLPNCREFWIDISIGFVIFLLLIGLHSIDWLGRVEDLGASAMMPLHRNTGVSDTSTPLVLVDIDERTYREWGMEPWVPREKLQTLISTVASTEPRLIVVDVDLSYPYCGQGRLRDDVVTNTDLVDSVATLLEKYPTLHIILVQSATTSSDSSDTSERSMRCAPEFGVPTQSRLHWALPAVRSDVDLVVRDWPLTMPLLNTQNEIITQPGIGPISCAVMLIADADVRCEPSKGLCLDDAKQYRQEATTEGFERLTSCLTRDIDIASGGSMIVFTLPWTLDGEVWPAIPGTGARLLTRVSAGALAKAGSVARLEGRIVVIGGSYADGRDHHPTPIGVMPGAMVVVNAIHSFLEFGTIEAPSLWLHLLIGLVEIVIAAWAFATFRVGLATLVSLLSIFIIMASWSYYWGIWYGVWIDATFPVLGISMHRWWMEAERMLLIPPFRA